MKTADFILCFYYMGSTILLSASCHLITYNLYSVLEKLSYSV